MLLLFTLLIKRSPTCFCISKWVTGLWIRIPTKLANQVTLSGVYIFSFSISYLYDAKNMLPGLSFFCGCLQKRGAKRIYLFDPSHKDNELQNSSVQQGGLKVGTPSHPQTSFWRTSPVTGVTPITSVSINSRCLAKKPVHVCWLQELLYVTVISLACFDQCGLQVSDSAQH